jgi:uroporphyrinogen-III synthase
VTQAVHQAPELGDLLAAEGAIPLFYPCIAIVPPEGPALAALDCALAELAAGEYAWLALTSANTVGVLADRLAHLGLPAGALAHMQVAAIGTATDDACAARFGRRADLVPADSRAEGLAAALLAAGAGGGRVLLPQADIARPILAGTLAAGGLQVTAVAAYRTTVGSGGIPLPQLLRGQSQSLSHSHSRRTVDAITFTSPSTVHNLLGRLLQEGGSPLHLQGIVAACIGPVTANALYTAGLPPAVTAPTQSLEGLVAALTDYYRNRP